MEQYEIILALLKYKEIHVRGIARLLNIPHVNVSRITKSLLKDNIVEFKAEGKNKIYYLKKSIESQKYVYMSEYYKALKLFKSYPSLSVIAESILSKTGEKLIIVFGSYAKFSADKNSDIDIYVETRNKKVKNIIENINSKISIKIGKFDKNSLLIKEIMKDHIILKGVEYYYQNVKVFD